MLDWIFEGIVTWISSAATKLMDAVSGLFLNALGTDMTAMEEYFPFVTKAFSAMQYTAWAILFLIFVWQLFRVFGGPITEAENPLILLARSAIFALLIGYAKSIFMIALNIARAPYAALMDITMSSEDFTFAGIEEVLKNGMTTLLAEASGIGTLLIAILMISLGWNYFKLLLETVERYIVVGVLCYTSPLAYSLGGSATTSKVFSSWCRMIGSQLLLLVMNVWFLRAFDSSVGYFIGTGGTLTTGQGSIFLWLFCALAFLKTAQRFDSYLASMGLNVAQTGSSMGMELLMAARVIGGAAHVGGRTVGSVFKGGSGGASATATGTGAAASGFASGFVSRFKGNSYARIAELEQYSMVEDGQEKIMFLYKVPKTLAQTPVSLTDGETGTVNMTLLAILGLSATAGEANGPYKTDEGNTGYLYYESDTIIDAFNALLEDYDPNNEDLSYLNNSDTYNPSVTKTLLEQWIRSSQAATLNKGTFPLTDSTGKAVVTDLPLGLYMVVETAVPEMVTDTTIPFLISLPMTNVNGGNVTNGGTNWVYDVTVYPKNLTGYPSLEKTVREARVDSGLNDGRTISDTIADNEGVIADGFAHNATASSGDTLQFQILSTIPAITSKSTYLKDYTFDDKLSKGLTYKKNDVQIEIFSDALCTSLVTTWKQNDSPAKFNVTYTTDAATGAESMKIELTEAGKLELNTSKAVFTSDTRVNSGFSDCTMRITYEATLDADSSAVMGDAGNDNRVKLTWRRTSSETEDYYDELVDDCHVYTYALNLTKQFSGSHESHDYSAVKFVLHNDDDNYYVKVQKTGDYYYVIGHLYDENDTDATHVNASGDADKSAVNKETAPDNAAVILTPILNDPDRDDDEMCIVIRGLEPNNYTLTEIATADGYTLLKDSIKITITATPTNEGSGNATKVCSIYSTDELGTVQNDPRRAYYEGGVRFKGGSDVTKPTLDVFGNTIAFSTNDLNTETNDHQAGTVHRVVQEGQVSLEHPKLVAAAFVTNSTTSRDNATIDDQAAEVSMITELVGVTKYGSDGKIENSDTNLDGINHIEVNGTTASTNAIVPLTVVNTRGFTLPRTGENGYWLYPAIGITVACGALFVLYLAFRRKNGKAAKQASTEA